MPNAWENVASDLDPWDTYEGLSLRDAVEAVASKVDELQSLWDHGQVLSAPPVPDTAWPTHILPDPQSVTTDEYHAGALGPIGLTMDGHIGSIPVYTVRFRKVTRAYTVLGNVFQWQTWEPLE